MKCNKCGKEFSEPIYPLHIKRCCVEVENEVKEEKKEKKTPKK